MDKRVSESWTLFSEKTEGRMSWASTVIYSTCWWIVGNVRLPVSFTASCLHRWSLKLHLMLMRQCQHNEHYIVIEEKINYSTTEILHLREVAVSTVHQYDFNDKHALLLTYQFFFSLQDMASLHVLYNNSAWYFPWHPIACGHFFFVLSYCNHPDTLIMVASTGIIFSLEHSSVYNAGISI